MGTSHLMNSVLEDMEFNTLTNMNLLCKREAVYFSRLEIKYDARFILIGSLLSLSNQILCSLELDRRSVLQADGQAIRQPKHIMPPGMAGYCGHGSIKSL